MSEDKGILQVTNAHMATDTKEAPEANIFTKPCWQKSSMKQPKLHDGRKTEA